MPPPSPRTLGRLLRLSLGASAPADIACGIVFASGVHGWPSGPAPWLLIAASSCVYHGGMALNDWVDRAHDARTRPERPIPSGAIAAGAALVLALLFLGAGAGLGLYAHPGAGGVLAVVAALAALYDIAGRGPWLGPLLLGACRAGNLGAGLVLGAALAGVPLTPLILAPAIAYGAYVFLVSRLGRLEDEEDAIASRRVSPRTLVRSFGLLLLVPAVLPATAASFASRAAAFALGLAGAYGLLRVSRRAPLDSAASIGPVMGMALRRLLVFTASVALVSGTRAGLVTAVAILAGYPLSVRLRRMFPPS